MAPVIEIAPKEARLFALAIRRLQARRSSRRTIAALFPDDGPLRRELYPKQLEFFRASRDHREILMLSANRVGKSIAGCYADTLHLTGLYDTYAPWWEGRRFPGPIRCWVWGTSDEKVKETVQEMLFGPPEAWGTGLIPGDTIVKIDRAVSPVKDAIDTAYIRHVSGGTSTLQFKSYKAGRTAAEGTYRHWIHGDEEMPADIYAECLLRTMDVGQGPGAIQLTFTPMMGLSETVRLFLPDGQIPSEGPQDGSRYVVHATWDDVPHLSTEEKAALLSSIPAYQRDARSRGLPVLGSGVIYPVPEADYLIDPFELPPHWLRAYGMDVGWNWTAAIWGAYERDTDTWYLYHDYKRGEAEPAVHAAAIQAPGPWICGVIDPASQGRSQESGTRLLDTYRALGLHIQPADHAVDAGIYEMWDRLSTGRMLVFSSLTQFRSEIRQYARDEKGRIIKLHDHLMDASRYLVLSGQNVARPVPVAKQPRLEPSSGRSVGWMG